MAPDGVKCAGAMTRDVAVYTVSITSVLIAFAVGKVRGVLAARPLTPWFQACAVPLRAGPPAP